ncbi:MAG TPA: metal-dependent transcriptional regulator, partial [bacterium]|nr:metal-dependent transcriptional regulator [bacterium]
LIVHEHYGYIELTSEGINKAKALYEKHLMLKKFLHQILGVDEKIAENDACKIEHYLSKETLERIIKFIDFIETCPQGIPEWLNNFYYFVKHEKRPPECKAKFLEKNSANKMVKLSDLKVGEKGKILKIADTGVLKSKLLSMGFVKDEIVKIEKIAPLGSPIDVLIKNTHISLRKEEAEKIIVEVLK